jgi:geranyl-CoA carboxylase alpha subunit
MHKILIANRGEIAVRVIRTARNLGFRTVAVYSEADADALHVCEADEAVCIGPASVGESYLLIDNILQAADKTGADAIHPGYGFVSENADFARACEAASMTFIGPGAQAMELMGSKRLSKIAMLEAGVPCIPGYQGADQSDDVLLAKAQDIGFPIMVKASAGGGGRGMRLVWQQADLAEQISTARSEAQSAFGSGELILERAVLEPRHIEIQVFADSHGNVVHLGERDCSIQRRHQKVVEEAPSPFVDIELRERMGAAAVEAARSCHYRGAGTVEFLVDKDKNFYFLEMNTRLQVEHPVTEMVTGQDLVAWQLAVAAGEPLPLTQSQIELRGHAIEVRLYAEDPRNNFMPQTGSVLRWDIPCRDGIRVDHGIQAGQVVSPHYDPMLAKVIAYGENRGVAARRAASALQDTCLLGVNNNKLFLQNILRNEVFIAGDATTAFIEQHFSDDASVAHSEPGIGSLARAALIYYQRGKRLDTGWSSASANTCYLSLQFEDKTYPLRLLEQDNSYRVELGEQSCELQLQTMHEQSCVLVDQDVREVCPFALAGRALYLDDGHGHFHFEDITHMPAVAGGAGGSGELKASMDGAIVNVLVQQGDTVAQGQTIVVLEAMKMEHQLKAGVAGTVASINAQVGQQVKARQLLASIAAPGQESSDGE